ncbi:MAG: hypothetical protein M1322_01485 [Candidatus Parvarchaeota archaeon]|nr:hypothetical protein [Candidatus Parvarchaeota archaeon]MCL5106776.1 hypothetical protein [Candidatus Parvarchaeota archaeon]
MQFNQARLNLIVLIIISVIAVIAVGGDIAASFSVVFKPISIVSFTYFVEIALITARIATLAGALVTVVFVALILLVNAKHTKDRAPWTGFFLNKERSKQFIRRIEILLLFGFLATVVFAVNAVTKLFLAYGLVAAFWLLAVLSLLIAGFSYDLYFNYFRRFS